MCGEECVIANMDVMVFGARVWSSLVAGDGNSKNQERIRRSTPSVESIYCLISQIRTFTPSGLETSLRDRTCQLTTILLSIGSDVIPVPT